METTQTIAQITQEKALKCPKGLGKLNRLIAKAQARLKDFGYDMGRFVRNYETGTAASFCKRTGITASVNINGKTEAERFVGEAFGKRAE